VITNYFAIFLLLSLLPSYCFSIIVVVVIFGTKMSFCDNSVRTPVNVLASRGVLKKSV